MPSAGSDPQPKIKTGSSTRLTAAPSISPAMVSFIRPTDCKIFSTASDAINTVEKENTMLA